MNKDTINAVLDFIVDALLAIQRGESWKWFRRLFKREIWKKYIKPAIDDQDFSWIPDALAYISILRVILGQLLADESLRQRALNDPRSVIR